MNIKAEQGGDSWAEQLRSRSKRNKMAEVRRRPQLPPNYNIHQMRLIHELKVAFPSVPDETVRLCLKKVGKWWVGVGVGGDSLFQKVTAPS